MSSAGPHPPLATSTSSSASIVESVLEHDPTAQAATSAFTSDTIISPSEEVGSLLPYDPAIPANPTLVSSMPDLASEPTRLQLSTAVPPIGQEGVEGTSSVPLFADDALSVDSEGVIIPPAPTVTSGFTGSASAVPSTSITPLVGVSTTVPGDSSSFSDDSSPSPSVSVPASQPRSTSTVFTVIGPPVSADVSAGPTISAADMQTFMGTSSSSIFDSGNRLFPLGVAAVTIGGILAILLIWLLYLKLSRRARRNRNDAIVSFSPITPYPFDAKAYNDAGMGSATITPDFAVDRSRRVPSFYHARSVGVASTKPLPQSPARPRIEVNYIETVRSHPAAPTLESRRHNDAFDMFNCAMFPAGTCPLEHENRMRNLHTLSTLRTDVPGSPVPSFQTDRMNQPALNQATDPASTAHTRGRVLTPPKTRHRPPPLVFRPSIDQWTNSVRGFTPRRSNTVSTRSDSSASSLYVPERV